MQSKERKPIFGKTLIACVLFVGFGIYIAVKGSTPKEDFESVIGRIDYFDKTFQEITYRGSGKHRFIHIVDFPTIFELFIGKDWGDFSPKFEQLDKLHLGDEITVYYAGKTPFQKNSDKRLNKEVQFIDKNGEAFFIRGTKDKYGGYGLIAFGILLAGVLLYLKKTKKII